MCIINANALLERLAKNVIALDLEEAFVETKTTTLVSWQEDNKNLLRYPDLGGLESK